MADRGDEFVQGLIVGAVSAAAFVVVVLLVARGA